MANQINQVPQAQGWYDLVKENIQLFWKKLDLTPRKVAEIIIYFGVGFFLGTTIKRYGKFILLTLLFILISLYLLQYFSIISINVARAKELAGVSGASNIDDMVDIYWVWAQKNVILVASGVFGFVIGYRVG